MDLFSGNCFLWSLEWF